MLYAESFSPNTAEGVCPHFYGIGRIHDVTEASMVPDDVLSIRQRAVAAWPSAWQGQNLRDILVTLGYDVDKPGRDLPNKDRDWILFTDEQQQPVYATALAELKAGAKRSHWMWFVFPQAKGLGNSSMAQRYAVRSMEEAMAYLAHPARYAARRMHPVDACGTRVGPRDPGGGGDPER